MTMTIKKIKELKRALGGKWGINTDYDKKEVCVGTTLAWGTILIGRIMEEDAMDFDEKVDVAKFIAALPEIAQLAIDQAEEIEKLNDIIDEMVKG